LFIKRLLKPTVIIFGLVISYFVVSDGLAYDRLRTEVGFFHGATKLDLLVLSLVGVLFMWHLIMLVKMTRN
jgi:hypothetical protein